MSRVSIYAVSREAREAIASLVRAEDDLEPHDGGDRAPRRLEDASERDVLLVSTDLEPSERLQILGLAWRSNHPPRMLFFDCSPEAPSTGRFVVAAEDRERCLAAIRGMAEGEPGDDRIRLSLRAAPSREGSQRDAAERAEAEAVPAVAV